MYNIKVSIIIPVYNASDYLERCLESVIHQTLNEIEIICINDCSTDNSLEIIQKYAKNDQRIKVIDCKVNGGESKARNIGLDNAIGEYIAFVDNDDVVDPDFYEKLYDKAKTGDFDISKGQAKLIKYDNSVDINNNDRIEKYGKHYFASCWWSAIYKKELIDKNNIRLPEGFVLGGDLLFLVNAVIYAKDICITNETFYNHIMRENSGDSKILPYKKVDSAIEIFNMICDNLNDALKRKVIKEYEYSYLYFYFSIGGEYLLCKSKEEKTKINCIQSIVNNYRKCIEKEAVLKRYIESDKIDIAYILKTNPDKLLELYFKDDEARVLFKLRAGMLMKNQKSLPKISIIIPVYNTEKYLERCLDSVCHQTLTDIEAICVDDCSTDHSLEFLENYAKKDSRIKIIKNNKNQGVSVARNLGIDKANGEYIAFLDSDDELDIYFCEKLYEKAQSKEDAVLGNCIRKTEAGEENVNTSKSVIENNNLLYFCNYFTTIIYKRDLLSKFNIKFMPSITLAEDLLFINEFLMYARTFNFANDAYYIYHRRLDSTDCAILSDEKVDSGFFAFNKMLDNFNSIPEIVANKKGYEYYFSNMFVNCLNMTLKNNNKEKRKDFAESLIKFYDKIIHKDALIEELKEKQPIVECYLRNHEDKKFIDLMVSVNSRQELIVKNLRFKVTKGI